MKKALFLLGFLCIILIASACSSDKRDPSSEYIQPFSFFYRTAETDYSRPDGLIRAVKGSLFRTNCISVAICHYRCFESGADFCGTVVRAHTG